MNKKKFNDYIKLIRVKHYLKNFLILLPLIFSGYLLNSNYLVSALIGFVEFSLICSVVYIINDINDKEIDMKHDKKKNRPIASGRVSVREGVIIIGILLTILIIILLIYGIKNSALLILLLYLIINLGYSFGLKNIPLVDICILTFGFVARVLFGGAITGVVVSSWLNLTVLAMAFFIALGKRRNEMNKTGKTTRKVLKYYTKEFLDKNMYMFLSIAIVFYSLWTVDDRVVNRINVNLLWTVPIVIIICMRYSMIVEDDNDGDPVEVVIHDKILLSLLSFYAITLIFILYLL